MEAHSVNEASRKRLFRWRHLFVGIGVLVLIAVFLSRSLAARRLSEQYELIRNAGEPVVAVDLNHWQTSVPRDENRAFAILEVANAISSSPPRANAFERLGHLEPLPAETKESLSQFVSNNRNALEIAHTVGAFKRSQYVVDWSGGPSTFVPYLAKAKEVTQLLRLEAILEMENGKCDRAARSTLHCFDVADSLTGEPILISQLVRNACLHLATETLERFLSKCSPSDEQLAELGRAITEAIQHSRDTMKRALVGERSIGNHCFRMAPAQMTQLASASDSAPPEMAVPIMEFLARTTGLRDWDQLFYLRAMQKWIAASSIEFPASLRESRRVNDELQIELGNKPFFYVSSMLLPSLRNTIERAAESSARLHAARAGVAIEQYRLTHAGNIPASLDELSPEFLAVVPEDPFDGKPLRFTRASEGYVVYSVGKDRSDQGGVGPPKTRRVTALYDLIFTVAR